LKERPISEELPSKIGLQM